jgi:hypothetical protein
MNLILAVAVTSLLSGWAVSALGYYTPFMYATPLIASVGAGMLSTLQVNSGHPAWIGFQALYWNWHGHRIWDAGCRGLGYTPSSADIERNCFSHVRTKPCRRFIQLRCAEFFTNPAPSLDARKIMESSASMIRHLIEPDILAAVLRAYNSAVMRAFMVAAALAAASVLGVLPLRWVNVERKRIEATPA